MRIPGVLRAPGARADEDGQLVELRRHRRVEPCVRDRLLGEVAHDRADHHDAQRAVDPPPGSAEDAVHEGLLLGRQLVVGRRAPDAIAPQAGHGLAKLLLGRRRRRLGARQRVARDDAGEGDDGRAECWTHGYFFSSSPHFPPGQRLLSSQTYSYSPAASHSGFATIWNSCDHGAVKIFGSSIVSS